MGDSGCKLGRMPIEARVSCGLGSKSDDLPAFVVVSSERGESGGSSNLSNGFLNSTYQGVVCLSTGEPILCLKPPRASTIARSARGSDAIHKLNV